METREVIEEFNEWMKLGQCEKAQKCLEEGVKKAQEEMDQNSLLILLNELIGYQREVGQVEESYETARFERELLKEMGLEGTIPYATTVLNIANAYRAGGRLEDSMDCYEEVLSLYANLLSPSDMLYAALYNNFSLLDQEMGEFKKAREHLLKALHIVKENKDTEFQEAITCANLAATCLNLNFDEEAMEYFKNAIAIFESQKVEDAHYYAALSSMGTYYYKKGEFQKASDCFLKARDGMKKQFGENEYYERLSINYTACQKALGKEVEVIQKRGLTICREFYEIYGAPMIHEKFLEYEKEIAVGLCGEGSDCFGFDDEISRDHDWGPGFCMWISDELYDQIGENLEKEYEALPKEFQGYKRRESSMGKGRVGVHKISAFYKRILGEENWRGNVCAENVKNLLWENIQDEALSAAVNGEVFVDAKGDFSKIREELKRGFPERIFYLKIAQACGKFSQGAQYNYGRMMRRKDAVAAEFSFVEGMKYGLKLLYYMKGEYPLHDKWLFQGILSDPDYQKESHIIVKAFETKDPEKKKECIEEFSKILAGRLYGLDIISDSENYLDVHTSELVRKASYTKYNHEELAQEVATVEFRAFQSVKNKGGRASCQDDRVTFDIMRKSQYLTWNRTMLLQYLYDFETEYERGHNLIEEKYGRMMESTVPLEYAEIADHFAVLTEEKKQIIEAIVKIQVNFMEEFSKEYPSLAGQARTVHTDDDNMNNTSYETYLRGELGTYSDKMLELYGRFIATLCKEGKNLAYLTMENSVHLYGYKDLKEAEERYAMFS